MPSSAYPAWKLARLDLSLFSDENSQDIFFSSPKVFVSLKRWDRCAQQRKDNMKATRSLMSMTSEFKRQICQTDRRYRKAIWFPLRSRFLML